MPQSPNPSQSPASSQGNSLAQKPTPSLLKLIGCLQQQMSTIEREATDKVYASQPAYAVVERAALDASTRRNLSVAVESLQRGAAPKPQELAAAQITARERFEVGIPVEQVLIGFRTSISVIHSYVLTLGMPLLDSAELVKASALLWEVSDAFTGRVVAVYAELEEAQNRSAHLAREHALRSILAGSAVLDDASLALLGLSRTQSYHAFVAAAPIPGVLCVASDDGAQGQAYLGLVRAGDSAGMAHLHHGQCVAVGKGMGLEGAGASADSAKAVFATARALGWEGVFSQRDLGWRLAIFAQDAVTEDYVGRFISRIDEVLVETMAAWLRCGRHVPRAAQELRVHVNTVRYRMERYAELTGFDAEDVDDLIGLLWALEFVGRYKKLRQSDRRK
ncbi:helix-turn-helix domain-containing protein [Corynebacterium lizhenjunii]|uniref:Helix-turn-helix domain-containing protein n=1 Tax=Corynebacterium lizhenjunii TaxID=2709394 RepID=A0A7T0KDI2_9CORY|nr:helix-turn-helix domain-containing protein [Corynebacterium lizhenjunii]QPK78788.1 helix-turn-helix domain-containing protein [Corynebacterium lizhenjunii]